MQAFEMRLWTRLLISILGLALLAGCKKTTDDGDGGPGPSPAAPHYTAIGASDALGVGGSVPCLPFTQCAGGTGYVPRILRALRAQDAALLLTNLGLPGAVMSREVQDIGNGVGIGINSNFLQHEAPFVPPTTTLVTIFAGANDANTLATAIDRGAAGGVAPNTYIDAQVAAFAEDYRELIGIIRGRAPGARIFVLNLPNFAGLPFAVGRSTRDRQWLQRLSVGFSVQGANSLVGMNVTVVDLLCDPRSYQGSTYSSDGFHPSDAGYAFIADETLDAVNAGNPSPPMAICPQMTIVPQ
jgi:lysophospholipase L1-like esterase